MFSHAAPAQANGSTDRLEPALGRWSADPLLAPLVESQATLLVLDARGERVLHASKGAVPLRSILADAEGRLHASLGLGSQIGRLGPLSGKPRIARLRLDPRGLAPGTPCQIARAPFEDGTTALLIAPLAAPLAAPRPSRSRGAAAQAEPAPEPPTAAPPAEITGTEASPGRLIWRSDSEGVLTHVSGAGPGVASALLGRNWPSVCEKAGSAEAEAVLAALRERRTFRALPLTVRLPSARLEIVLDVSGAPSGRANGTPTGFAGFAVIRGQAPIAEPETDAEAPASHTDVPVSAGSPSDRTLPPTEAEIDRPAEPVTPHAPPDPVTDERAPLAEPTSELSTDEHAAFREIARALGARFAGDAPRPSMSPDFPPLARDRSSSLSPPAATAAKPVDRTDMADALASAFERLPAGVLVHRGDAILFANRRLMDLTGHADLRALRQSPSSSSLTAASSSEAADGGGEAVTLTTGTGGRARLAVDRSSLDWDGGPATLILARPLPEPVAETPVAPPARESEPDPQALLDRLEDGVVTLDAAGHVLRLNPRAEAILAEAAAQVVGKPLTGLVTANAGLHGGAGEPASERPAQGAGARESREAGALGEGSATPLRVRIGRLLSSEDSPLYATLQDMAEDMAGNMAEAKRSEEEAAAGRRADEAARRRLAFFAKAGQEVRSSLSGIVGIAEAMLAEQFGPLGSERYREDLRDIQASGGQALGALADLVELAEMEAGRVELAFADLPLNDLVARCIAELQPQAARRRIVLRTSLAEDLETLHADERSLRSATVKVLANAIRLTEAGGQVIVSTTLAERGDIALRVRDTGSGMSPEQVDHALDPFGQPRMPGARNAGGTGLGLTVTKALVEANRGTLRVTSRKDEGTLVEMIFPGKAARA